MVFSRTGKFTIISLSVHALVNYFVIQQLSLAVTSCFIQRLQGKIFFHKNSLFSLVPSTMYLLWIFCILFNKFFTFSFKLRNEEKKTISEFVLKHTRYKFTFFLLQMDAENCANKLDILMSDLKEASSLLLELKVNIKLFSD